MRWCGAVWREVHLFTASFGVKVEKYEYGMAFSCNDDIFRGYVFAREVRLLIEACASRSTIIISFAAELSIQLTPVTLTNLTLTAPAAHPPSQLYLHPLNPPLPKLPQPNRLPTIPLIKPTMPTPNAISTTMHSRTPVVVQRIAVDVLGVDCAIAPWLSFVFLREVFGEVDTAD
jgi:hypothetical protein